MTSPTVDFAPVPPADRDDATLVLFVDRALAVPADVAGIAGLDQALVRRAAADAGFGGHAGEALTIFSHAGGLSRRTVLVGTAIRAGNLALLPVDLGGYAAKGAGLARHVVVAATLPSGAPLPAAAAAELALGFRLRGYRFDKYRTRSDDPRPPEGRRLTVLTAEADAARAAFAAEAAVAEGVELARDLVNEPPNVLTPPAFAGRVAALRETGLEVEVLRAADLERLGFRALLAVGQGSAEEAHVAILRWQGAPDGTAPPMAAIGKGVCFDAGGLSLKQPAEQIEMKGDMAGAAAVVGFMLALARRSAKVNALGVIGLVENLPDGRAQRPGDIVRSLSGQTIEVQDTDSEGRLVLADLLWHVQDRYAPRFMIDLATLTDAVAAGIGRDYAGLFANDDDLASLIARSGDRSGEVVWRLPLGPHFDQQMDSIVADMKNLDAKMGGGCTAAAFLQRFVNGRPWAHLDIAAPAQAMPESAINTSWGTGWGVRLLDQVARRIEAE